eukprot:7377275-Prymnesium_polylepis.1
MSCACVHVFPYSVLRPPPYSRIPCFDPAGGASHAGLLRAAAPQGGQARLGRVPARACGACAARGSAGGKRADRSGRFARLPGGLPLAAGGSPQGVRGAPSRLEPAGNGLRAGKWSCGVAQVPEEGFGEVWVGRNPRDPSRTAFLVARLRNG